MICLNRNEDTNVVITLLEKTTLSPVYYLLEVTSSIEDVSYIVLDTIVTTSERYNEFTINIELPIGEYTYRVYQSSIEEPTIEDVDGLVESGVLIIESDEELNETYL